MYPSLNLIKYRWRYYYVCSTYNYYSVRLEGLSLPRRFQPAGKVSDDAHGHPR